MKFARLQNGKNGLGGTVRFVDLDTADGQKEFNDCTNMQNENYYKVATDANGEMVTYSEQLVEQIANDAAEMSGKKKTSHKISAGLSMEV